MGEIADIPSPGVPLAFGVPGDPAAIVVPDGYGRLPWLEPFATALADRARLRVLVPDLYQGVATDDPEQAERLLAEFSLESALGEVQSAIDDARAEGSSRIGLVGFGTCRRNALRG